MTVDFGFPDGPEVPLDGGDVTVGVVRISDTVRRPHGASSELVTALLTRLEAAAFDGAPRYLGVDAADRDVLTFVHGEAAPRPWPHWVGDEQRALSVARLTRRYDDAAIGLGLDDWPVGDRTPWIPGAPASLSPAPEFIGHMDITPENVIFRDGVAAALIDFDLARPVSRADEVCNLLLWWAPLMPPADREDAVRGVDAFERARRLVDAYGLDAQNRAVVASLAINQAERSWFTMQWRSENLGGGWARMWGEGVGDRILRRREWLESNRDRLSEAIE